MFTKTSPWTALNFLTSFSCDQAVLRIVQSVYLPVLLYARPPICPPLTHFWQCSSHRIIMKLSGVITIDKNDVRIKGQGQRSKVKVAEVRTQFSRFRTVTPIWINLWRWNDAQSLMWHRRGALLLFKVIRQISRSHGTKIANFDLNWAFLDCNSSLKSPLAMKWYTQLEIAISHLVLQFPILFCFLLVNLSMKMPQDKRHGTFLNTSTPTTFVQDLCHHMVSLCHNELNRVFRVSGQIIGDLLLSYCVC